MKSILKVLSLFGVFILVMMTAIAYTVPGVMPLQEVLRPILLVGVLLLAVHAVRGDIAAVFTKHHTAATGCG